MLRWAQRGTGKGDAVSATPGRFATRNYADAALRRRSISRWEHAAFRCYGISGLSAQICPSKGRNLFMITLQPAEWSKPRGFSHGVALEGPGRWIVLAGQTGGDEKGEYQPDMAVQVATALRRIIKLLGEAGAGPEHIVRLTWYLTSRSEYEAAGAGIGAAWKETLGRNFPPSTLLYIDGLVDVRAKVELEVTAFVPAA
jgi:enamine deaminase RidA (YjgF/YER057c/UK114 family)